MIFATNKNKALTFLELLVVLVVIGILTGISIPKFRKTLSNLEFESFVKDIYYLSRYLQGSAISQAKIYSLNISGDLKGIKAHLLEEDMFLNIGGRFAKTYKVPSGINISLEPPDKKGIYFYPDGSVDKTKIIFSYDAKDLILSFSGATGDIQIQ